MYGKKRIIFRKDCTVVFAGEGSWSPMGYHGCGPTPGTTSGKSPATVQARLLKEKYRYTRPTADHMYQIIKADNPKALKAAIAAAYSNIF